MADFGTSSGETFVQSFICKRHCGKARRAVDEVAEKKKDPYSAVESLVEMSMKIDHLGIAVPKIDDALAFWGDALGLENVHTEEVADQKVKVAMLPVGETNIELLEPTSR